MQFGQHCVGSVQRKRREDHVLVELQLSIFGEMVFLGLLSPSTSEFPTPFTRFHRRSHYIAHSDFTKMHNCPDKTHVIWAHLHILFSHCTCNFICIIFSPLMYKKQIKTQRLKSVHFLEAKSIYFVKIFAWLLFCESKKNIYLVS